MSEVDHEIVRAGKIGDLGYTITDDGSRVGKCGDVQNPADAESLTRGRFKGRKSSSRINQKSRQLEALAMLLSIRRA